MLNAYLFGFSAGWTFGTSIMAAAGIAPDLLDWFFIAMFLVTTYIESRRRL